MDELNAKMAAGKIIAGILGGESAKLWEFVESYQRISDKCCSLCKFQTKNGLKDVSKVSEYFSLMEAGLDTFILSTKSKEGV